MRFVIPILLAYVLLVLLGAIGYAAPGIGSDHNNDGIVSHADYSVIGDRFGTSGPLPNEVVSPGTVDNADFAAYVSRYGNTSSELSTLPFFITPSATVSGNISWLIGFSGVNGALAGHLNIRTNDIEILSANEGSFFQDDGDAPVGVPGIPAPEFGLPTIDSGIEITGSLNSFLFAALGTNLVDTTPTPPPFSNATLTFLTVVTRGSQFTTLTVKGGNHIPGASEYGYQGRDYYFASDQSASFSAAATPEPASFLVWFCLIAGATIRSVRTRN